MPLEVITNNVPRPLIYWGDLPEKVREEYAEEEWASEADWVFYKGHYYPMCDFMRIGPDAPDIFQSWHGYCADSFFSGVLIRIGNAEGECTGRVVMGTYLS